MSGLNKQSKNVSAFISVTIIYFFCLGALLYLGWTLPTQSVKQNEQKIVSIQEHIQSALMMEEPIPALQQLQADESIELVIFADSELYYRTLPVTDLVEFEETINQKAIVYKSIYNIVAEDTVYTTGLVIYKGNNIDMMNQLILFICIIISVLFGSISVILLLLQRRMLSPLKRLRELTRHLLNYEFKQQDVITNDTEYDAITQGLQTFALDLEEKLEVYGQQYSNLELTLQARNEVNEYNLDLATSLVHDLKTPLNIMMLQLQRIKTLNPNETTQVLLDEIEDENERIIAEINDVVKMLHTSNDIDRSYQVFDFIALFKDMLKKYQTAYTAKNVYCDIDIPSQLMVEMNLIECKQILHNIFSNSTKYVDTGGVVNFSITTENDDLLLRQTNTTHYQNIDFNKVFQLFYSMDQTNKTNSGIGLYTIKRMADLYQGTCEFSPVGDEVCLKISLKDIVKN